MLSSIKHGTTGGHKYELMEPGWSHSGQLSSSSNRFEPSNNESRRESRTRRSLFRFILERPGTLVTLFFGTVLAFGCFSFTYWLSSRNVECPPWAIFCSVSSNAQYFTARLGLVQGLLSSIYGISIAMIVYAGYQIAETTLWPSLAQQPFSLREIDHFLAHVRGSLLSFPFTGRHAFKKRRRKHIMVLLIVFVAGALLEVNATLVGWSFTVRPMATRLYSNHTFGGGMGFQTFQGNPAPVMPAEPGQASSLYTSWSIGQSVEPLSQLRGFLLDRLNLSLVGNFSVHALETPMTVNCSGLPIDIRDLGGGDINTGGTYVVPSLLPESTDVLLRYNTALTAWVYSVRNVSQTRAITRLFFAQLNGTIEGGHTNELTTGQKEFCSDWLFAPCPLGISSLACDVDIDVRNGTACMSNDFSNPNVTLSALELTSIDGNNEALWPIAYSLAVQSTILGPYVAGTQPMLQPGLMLLPNSTFSLPTAYSDVQVSLRNQNFHWSQANLTNFIKTAAGALNIYVAQAVPLGASILESTVEIPRLDSRRSFILLVPPGVALLSVLLLTLLSILMHREANILETRLGWTSELLISGDTPDVRIAVDSVRAGIEEKAVIERLNWQYGVLSRDQGIGLGREGNVSSFEPQRRL